MQLKLDLFKSIADEVDLSNRANLLLEALNEGLKLKEKFKPFLYSQINDLIVLVAINQQKKHLLNVIDLEGKTPLNFSACWRSANHIQQEITEHLQKQGKLI